MVHLQELHQVTGASSTTAGSHDDDEHQQQEQLTVAAVHGESGEKKKEKAKHEVVPQLRFPPGFRFVPSDLELLDVFLRGKIDGRKLPLEVVFFEVPILDWEPHKLVEARKAYGVDRWYFFTRREPSSTNKPGEPRRRLHNRVGGLAAGWKATGTPNSIVRRGAPAAAAAAELVVGVKKLLLYNVGGKDDKWSMHEYALAGRDQMGEFVLCTIQEKLHGHGKRRRPGSEKTSKRKKKEEEETVAGASTSRQPEEEGETPIYYSDPPPPPPLSEHHGRYSQHHLAALQEEEYPMPPPLLLPLLDHGQFNHHQASLQEEHAMAFGVDQLEGYLDGDHHDYHLVDVATEEQDTLAYDGSGELEPPLMMPQQDHGYKALLEEMNYLEYTQQLFINGTNPVYAQDHNQGQQSMWGQTQISSQVNEYTTWHDHHFYQQPAAQKSGALEDMFGIGSPGLLVPGSVLKTSPETVLQGPEPLSYEAPSGDDTPKDDDNYCDDVGNNGGNDVARMAAAHVCRHGGEWRQQPSVGVVSFNLVVRCCFWCVQSCESCKKQVIF